MPGQKPVECVPGVKPARWPPCQRCKSRAPLVWTGDNLDLHLCQVCADKEIAGMLKRHEERLRKSSRP